MNVISVYELPVFRELSGFYAIISYIVWLYILRFFRRFSLHPHCSKTNKLFLLSTF
jgi:hypothetical protein